MKLEEMQNILKQVSFKDWAFFVYESPYGETYFKIEFAEANADHEYQRFGPTVPVLFRESFPAKHILTEVSFLDYVNSCIRKVLDHERKEWFKYKGKQVEDPHPEIRNLFTPKLKGVAYDEDMPLDALRYATYPLMEPARTLAKERELARSYAAKFDGDSALFKRMVTGKFLPMKVDAI